MSHISAKNAYKSLEERLNRFPQGAPPSKTLYKILAMLFTEKEAELVAQLPIKAFRVKTAAKIWGVSESEAIKVLDRLASRAILLDLEDDKGKQYILPPPMAGFIEFALMRTRNDIDQKVLAELYYQYLNVEEDFIKDLFYSAETKLGRVFVQEEVLTNDNEVTILDYEKATHIIEEAEHIAVGMCYCRHKMKHVGKGCDAPMDICMTFNGTANSLIKYNYARRIDASECKELLHQAYEHNLVQCGENVRKGVNFICNCCGCCCEALLAARKFGSMHPVSTTSFIPNINYDTCASCGKCVKACPIGAISKVKENDKNIIKIDKNGIITLMRHSDEIQSKMVFEKDKKHTFPYCTKYGKIEMVVDLKEVNCNLNNCGGSIELHYTLRTGIELLSENVTVIKIKEENKSV